MVIAWKHSAHFLPGFIQIHRIFSPIQWSINWVNFENCSLENNIWVFCCLLEGSWYNTGSLASTLIFYCKAAKQSCLFIEISLKGKGEKLLTIPLKIFVDSLRFDLTSKLALLQVRGWTRWSPKLSSSLNYFMILNFALQLKVSKALQ